MTLGGKTLDDLLAPISLQLGRRRVPEAIDPLPDIPQPARVTDGLSQAQLVDMFVDEAQKVRVTVHRCTVEQVCATIARIVATASTNTATAVSADATEEAGKQEAACINNSAPNPSIVMDATPELAQFGIAQVCPNVTVWDAARGFEANREVARTAAFGITHAAYGIAETGTVVQPISAQCGRAISLLPLTHIAVVSATTIVPTMRESLAGIQHACAAYGGKHAAPDSQACSEYSLPSQVCFISGPSVTSDIELVRVEGVHGPMYVHYVVVENL